MQHRDRPLERDTYNVRGRPLAPNITGYLGEHTGVSTALRTPTDPLTGLQKNAPVRRKLLQRAVAGTGADQRHQVCWLEALPDDILYCSLDGGNSLWREGFIVYKKHDNAPYLITG